MLCYARRAALPCRRAHLFRRQLAADVRVAQRASLCRNGASSCGCRYRYAWARKPGNPIPHAKRRPGRAPPGDCMHLCTPGPLDRLAPPRLLQALASVLDEGRAIVREHERGPTRPRTAFSFYRRATREQVRVANALMVRLHEKRLLEQVALAGAAMSDLLVPAHTRERERAPRAQPAREAASASASLASVSSLAALSRPLDANLSATGRCRRRRPLRQP